MNHQRRVVLSLTALADLFEKSHALLPIRDKGLMIRVVRRWVACRKMANAIRVGDDLGPEKAAREGLTERIQLTRSTAWKACL